MKTYIRLTKKPLKTVYIKIKLHAYLSYVDFTLFGPYLSKNIGRNAAKSLCAINIQYISTCQGFLVVAVYRLMVWNIRERLSGKLIVNPSTRQPCVSGVTGMSLFY